MLLVILALSAVAVLLLAGWAIARSGALADRRFEESSVRGEIPLGDVVSPAEDGESVRGQALREAPSALSPLGDQDRTGGRRDPPHIP
jgi:hypothetical protein